MGGSMVRNLKILELSILLLTLAMGHAYAEDDEDKQEVSRESTDTYSPDSAFSRDTLLRPPDSTPRRAPAVVPHRDERDPLCAQLDAGLRQQTPGCN
jgi:hypothetical protein